MPQVIFEHKCEPRIWEGYVYQCKHCLRHMSDKDVHKWFKSHRVMNKWYKEMLWWLQEIISPDCYSEYFRPCTRDAKRHMKKVHRDKGVPSFSEPTFNVRAKQEEIAKANKCSYKDIEIHINPNGSYYDWTWNPDLYKVHKEKGRP